jgi:hypothetical protein
MLKERKSMTEIVLDDGLINDFEFELSIYEAGFLEAFQNYLGKLSPVFPL